MRRLAAMALGLTLTAGAPCAAAAQSALGFKAGVDHSSLIGADAGSTTARDRLVIGAFFGTAISNHLAIQMELLYSRQGVANFVNPADATGAGPATLSTTFIELPFLLRAGFPTRKVLFSVYAGPVLSLRSSCEIRTGGVAAKCSSPGTPQGFSPRGTNVAAAAGGGIDVSLGGGTIFLDGRYSVSMLSIEAGSMGMKARRATTSLMAGLAFPIGR
jgi:hypothetical protein